MDHTGGTCGHLRSCRTRLLPASALLGLVLALCLRQRVEAQFTIGVWQPGGHVLADTSFLPTDAARLDSLGVDLLVDSTPRVDLDSPADSSQQYEQAVAEQWCPYGSFAVYYEPEGFFWGRTLEYYAGSTSGIYQPWLNNTVDLLRARWSA